MVTNLLAAIVVSGVLAAPALAGPPYVLDDPEPTDNRHFEIYVFGTGTTTKDGSAGEAGIDFNYGGGTDLQLTAVLPMGFSQSPGGFETGLGNIELAVKYRFLKDVDGWNVAVFPRLFLPSGSPQVGERNASLFLPIWVGKDWGKWTTFGGGGCEHNRGGNDRNFCIVGWVLTRTVLPDLHLGAEILHHTSSTKGGGASTSVGAGAVYDISDTYHLLGYLGRGVQNADETNRMTWYSSVLFTF